MLRERRVVQAKCYKPFCRHRTKHRGPSTALIVSTQPEEEMVTQEKGLFIS